MQEFEKLGKKYLSGVDSGKLSSLLQSEEIAKLSRIIDPESVEAAAKNGDSAALSNILAKILSTSEGKLLASRLKEMK